MSGDNSLSFVTHVIVVSVSNSPWLLRAEKKPGKVMKSQGKVIFFYEDFFDPEKMNIL